MGGRRQNYKFPRQSAGSHCLEPDPRYPACCGPVCTPGRKGRDTALGFAVLLTLGAVVAGVVVVCLYVIPDDQQKFDEGTEYSRADGVRGDFSLGGNEVEVTLMDSPVIKEDSPSSPYYRAQDKDRHHKVNLANGVADEDSAGKDYEELDVYEEVVINRVVGDKSLEKIILEDVKTFSEPAEHTIIEEFLHEIKLQEPSEILSSPEPSPEPSPKTSPEPSPEPSPELSREPSRELSPEPSPEYSPERSTTHLQEPVPNPSSEHVRLMEKEEVHIVDQSSFAHENHVADEFHPSTEPSYSPPTNERPLPIDLTARHDTVPEETLSYTDQSKDKVKFETLADSVRHFEMKDHSNHDLPVVEHDNLTSNFEDEFYDSEELVGEASEAAELAVCTLDMFMCYDGSDCIDQTFRCDGVTSCFDNSDEENCTTIKQNDCSGDKHFRCETSGRCIPSSWVCDESPDCDDKSDERDCPTGSAGPTDTDSNGDAIDRADTNVPDDTSNSIPLFDYSGSHSFSPGTFNNERSEGKRLSGENMLPMIPYVNNPVGINTELSHHLQKEEFETSHSINQEGVHQSSSLFSNLHSKERKPPIAEKTVDAVESIAVALDTHKEEVGSKRPVNTHPSVNETMNNNKHIEDQVGGLGRLSPSQRLRRIISSKKTTEKGFMSSSQERQIEQRKTELTKPPVFRSTRPPSRLIAYQERLKEWESKQRLTTRPPVRRLSIPSRREYSIVRRRTERVTSTVAPMDVLRKVSETRKTGTPMIEAGVEKVRDDDVNQSQLPSGVNVTPLQKRKLERPRSAVSEQYLVEKNVESSSPQDSDKLSSPTGRSEVISLPQNTQSSSSLVSEYERSSKNKEFNSDKDVTSVEESDTITESPDYSEYYDYYEGEYEDMYDEDTYYNDSPNEESAGALIDQIPAESQVSHIIPNDFRVSIPYGAPKQVRPLSAQSYDGIGSRGSSQQRYQQNEKAATFDQFGSTADDYSFGRRRN